MSRRERYHHGDLPAALQRIVLDVIQESGVDGVTMSAVARRAGVSVASPYRHYDSFEALLVATATSAYERLRARLDEAQLSAAADTPWDQLEAVITAAFSYLGGHAAEAQLILDGRLVQWSPPYARLIAGEFERVAQLTSLTVGAPIADCRTLALNISALVLGHLNLHMRGLSPVSSLTEAPALALDGIRDLVAESRRASAQDR